MKSKRRFLIAPVLLLILILAGWYYYQPGSILRGRSSSGSASGTIEAERLAVTTQVSGRVVEILVREGDRVAAGAVVARLDSDAANAEVARARAALAEAQARRDLARNGARPEDKSQADAIVAQAMAARNGAKQAVENAQTILMNPQELNARIDTVRAQIAVASQQMEAARAQEAQAIVARDKYLGDGSALGKTMLASYDLQVQATQESILAATAQRDGAQIVLNDLRRILERPLDLQTQVHQAEGHYQEAEAAIKVAQAARDLVYAGATEQDLAITEAAVRQAQGVLNAAQVQLEKLTLRAPAAGQVSQRFIQVGQVLAPGTSAFTLVNSDRVTLTLYYPEDRIGDVYLDQPARVSIDSFPGRTFDGKVAFISAQAEFTPRNVETIEGRVSQVFAVKIRLDNSDYALKPGMPADAVLATR